MRPAYSIRVLLLISILAAVPRLFLAANQPLNYDEHWHLFVAQQDTRAGFAGEWRSNAHPPLYYWLLRLPIALARNRLLDRSISLLAGVAAVFLVGHIVSRITSNPAVPLLAGLVLALSESAVLISTEVRSYMLAVVFILLAFCQYLSLVQGHHPMRAAIRFSFVSSLALMSHYFTAFFLLACLAAGLYTVAVHARGGSEIVRLSRDRWASLAMAMLPILVTAAWLYRTHLRALPRPQNHVWSFYYHPESGERLLDFLVSATYNTVNLFSPVALGTGASVPEFIAALALLAAALVYFGRIRARSREGLRWLALLFLFLIAGELLIASLKGAYPFGGDLRHQFILFPFLVITAAVLLDSAISRWRAAAVPLTGLAVVGICLNGVLHLGPVQRSEGGGFATMFAKEMALYAGTFPAPEAVYLDQFSLIVFFAHHDERQWRSLDADTYEVKSGGGRIVVLRDRARWNVNLLDERFYQDVAARLKSRGLESTTLFSLRFPFPSEPWGVAEQEALRRQVPILAARHQLETQKLVLDGFNAFAQFRLSRQAGRERNKDECRPPALARRGRILGEVAGAAVQSCEQGAGGSSGGATSWTGG